MVWLCCPKDTASLWLLMMSPWVSFFPLRFQGVDLRPDNHNSSWASFVKILGVHVSLAVTRGGFDANIIFSLRTQGSEFLKCQMIDRYAWVYDMLIVYAAGNAGFQQAPDIGTVPAPALCKNVLVRPHLSVFEYECVCGKRSGEGACTLANDALLGISKICILHCSILGAAAAAAAAANPLLFAVGATDNWRARDIEEGQALVDSSGNQRDISTETFSSESGLLFHVGDTLQGLKVNKEATSQNA
eukprot:1148607-Pelagomonas_calceolata.AAC.9